MTRLTTSTPEPWLVGTGSGDADPGGSSKRPLTVASARPRAKQL